MKLKEKLNLYETLFYGDMNNDLKTYNEDGQVPPLLNRLVEGIFVTIPNAGISKQINHEIECYFFNSCTKNNNMKLEQSCKEMVPDKLVLKERENVLKLSREQFTMKYRVFPDKVCKLKYTTKEPLQLTRTYYTKEKNRLKEDTTVISFFNEQGFEMRRIEEKILMTVSGIISKFHSKLSTLPIVELKETLRDTENPEQARVIIYQQYLDNFRQDGKLQVTSDDIYLIECEDIENLSGVKQKLSELSARDKKLYYQRLKENYLFQEYQKELGFQKKL